MKIRYLVAGAIVSVMVTSVATAATSARTFGDGTYRVPRDVPAGTYRAKDADGCYWARLKNFSGSFNALIANENSDGPTLVTIKRTDRGFETTRCGRWTSDLRRITSSRTRFGEGKYIVGVDIAPGTYRARGEGCYWARLRGFSGDFNELIANGNPDGQAIVTIARSDRGFESARCGTWKRF